MVNTKQARKFLKKEMKYPFVRFSMVGAAVAVVDFAIYIAMIYLGFHYLLAVAVAFTVGTVIKFTFEKGFVFGNKSKHRAKQFTVFEAFSVVDFLLNMFLMFVFVDFLLLGPIVSRVVTSFIAFLLIYVVHKDITFNTRFFK
jgi:putative flippase GtrA